MSETAAGALSFLDAEAAPRICMKMLKSGLTLASLALCLLAPIGARAATISAASTSQADVTKAVNSASDGDTVLVPAGSSTWNSNLTILKNISLIGAGSNNTIITAGTNTILVWQPTIDNPFRMSGFRFNCKGTTNAIGIIGKCSKARIDNCYFDYGDSPICTNYIGWNATGRVAGVVDHCTFHNIERLLICDIRGTEQAYKTGGAGWWGGTSWNEGVQPGTATMLYWEDNQFVYDSNVANQPGNVDATFYGDYGGVAVIRHNTFSGYALNYIDAHGDQVTSNNYGTVYFEIYNNTFTRGNASGTGGATQGYFENQRGGMRIQWGNNFNGTVIPVVLMKYYSNDITVISNTYYWGDKWNSDTSEADMVSVPSGVGYLGNTYPGVNLKQNYFFARPQPGQAFHPYTALTYPHPLVAGAGSATRPSPPASLRVRP